MNDSIFEVEIYNNNPKGYEAATSLPMPATWAEFHDALQKARIEDGRTCRNEILTVHFQYLSESMIGKDVNLYDLNLLAQRLASLDKEQKIGMGALLIMTKMEQRPHPDPIPLERLINLTYNTDACRLVSQVYSDQELGKFLYENKMLSDEAMVFLDTTEDGSDFRDKLQKLLGEKHRQENNGVFTRWGYSELCRSIQNIYVYQPGEVCYFQRSDAPVVLEVKKRNNYGKAAVLNLPAIDAEISQADVSSDEASVEECDLRCTDCLIPSLRDAVNNALHNGDISQVNEFARKLAQKERVWGEAEFAKYKALLEAGGCTSLQDAVQIMEEAGEYELYSGITGASSYAEMVLREQYPDLPEELFRNRQAASFGQKLLDEKMGVLTDYGLIRRKDGQPIQDICQESLEKAPSGPQLEKMEL